MADLRAFVPSHVPVIALTATATAKVKKIVVKDLGIERAYIIAESPNRSNIKYIVVNTPVRKPYNDPNSWTWLIDRLMHLEDKAPRLIIYCRSHEQCTDLYGIFQTSLGKKSKLFAMYHGSTDSDVQKYIVEDFEKANGQIRVLFATIAFGMGVNVKGVHTVLHMGSSMAIDDYMQESGRCGRDGAQSVSVILAYPGMYRGTRTEESMKQYIVNKLVCRRKLLLDAFGYVVPEDLVKHECCDICAVQCDCSHGMSACHEETEIMLGLQTMHLAMIQFQLPSAKRVVSDNQKYALREKLTEYRLSLLDLISQPRYLAGGDLESGVPNVFIDDIVSECEYVFSFLEFCTRYPFYDSEHSNKIWDILKSVFGEHDECIINEQEELPQVTQHDEDEEEDESDDADIDTDIRGNPLVYESDGEYEDRLYSSSSDAEND